MIKVWVYQKECEKGTYPGKKLGNEIVWLLGWGVEGEGGKTSVKGNEKKNGLKVILPTLPTPYHHMRQVFTKIQAHTHTQYRHILQYQLSNCFSFSHLLSYPRFKWDKMPSHQEGEKCWELGSVYVHKIVLEACLACAHGNKTLTHPTSIITLATSFWSSPQQQRPGTCVSKRKETKMNAFLIGFPGGSQMVRNLPAMQEA